MRPKVSLELKVEALGLLKTGLSVSSVSKQLKIPSGVLQTWSLIYAKEGERGLAAYPKNICTGSIKDKILWKYREKEYLCTLLAPNTAFRTRPYVVAYLLTDAKVMLVWKAQL